MVNRMQFYIDGAWVDPAVKKSTPVVNPATEEAMYEVALGSKADLDKAGAAAKRAFVGLKQEERWLEKGGLTTPARTRVIGQRAAAITSAFVASAAIAAYSVYALL